MKGCHRPGDGVDCGRRKLKENTGNLNWEFIKISRGKFVENRSGLFVVVLIRINLLTLQSGKVKVRDVFIHKNISIRDGASVENRV